MGESGERSTASMFEATFALGPFILFSSVRRSYHFNLPTISDLPVNGFPAVNLLKFSSNKQ